MNKEEKKEYMKKYYEEHREERKKYLEEHREEQKENWKKYREEHKEERKKQMKKYNEEHREERKKYLEEHKEELKEKWKKYNEEHKEERKKQMKKYNEEHREEMKKYREEHREELKEKRKKYNEEHKEELKKYTEKIGWYYKKLSGWKHSGINISYPEYCILWIKQDRGCKICQKPLRLWYVEGKSPIKYKKIQTANADHDHRTGKVRGLLCSDCNRGLGHFERRKINGLWFINALEYLLEYESIDLNKYKSDLNRLKDLINGLNLD